MRTHAKTGQTARPDRWRQTNHLHSACVGPGSARTRTNQALVGAARWGRHPSVSPSPSKGSRPGSAMACTTPVERWGFCTFWASGCPEEGGQPRWGRGPIAGPGNQVGSCRPGRAGPNSHVQSRGKASGVYKQNDVGVRFKPEVYCLSPLLLLFFG